MTNFDLVTMTMWNYLSPFFCRTLDSSSMDEENRLPITYQSVEVQDLRKITNHLKKNKYNIPELNEE